MSSRSSPSVSMSCTTIRPPCRSTVPTTTHAITWGHSKARRPDLKQLLYNLTVTSDGNVPVFFSSASGNTVDDRTHIGTWDLLYELIGHADFLYVADCKLASSDNLSHIATRGGRFVTVLPRGRSEDIAFRQRLRAEPSVLKWTLLHALTNDQGHIVDELFVCGDDHVHYLLKPRPLAV